jgi:hypothetical protein
VLIKKEANNLEDVVYFFLCIILAFTWRDSGKLRRYSGQPIGFLRFKLCTPQTLVEYNDEQISFQAHFNFSPSILATLLLGMLGDATNWSSHEKFGGAAFKIISLDHRVLSALSRRENGAYDGTESACKILTAEMAT